jgi:RimJ/RimL family protein N-acetyltransferase
LLEGKNVNLRIVEKENLPLLLKWINDPGFFGEYNPLEQETMVEMEKSYDTAHPDRKRFFVEKKDGTNIGVIGVFPEGDLWEVGFALVSGERGKGYSTEAVTMMVDYLFLSRDLVRIQSRVDPRNMVSSIFAREDWLQKRRCCSQVHVHIRRVERYGALQHS